MKDFLSRRSSIETKIQEYFPFRKKKKSRKDDKDLDSKVTCEDWKTKGSFNLHSYNKQTKHVSFQ